MNRGIRFEMGLAILLFVLFGMGCGRLTNSKINEEKEAHFLAGKNRLDSHDYQAAVDAFEKSLQVIPASASAHLELGLIHQKHFGKHARAIYHFEKMLEHRPEHPLAERIVEQMDACKLALAAEVTLPPVNQRVEAEMKQLIDENTILTNRITQLKGELNKLKTSLAARVRVDSPLPVANRSGESSGEGRASLSSSNRSGRLHFKHVIQSGETFYSLARHYGLDFREIQKVNPSSKPTALQIGQVVNIPLSQTALAR